MKRSNWKKILLNALLLLILTFGFGVIAWIRAATPASEKALEALQSDQLVEVQEEAGEIRFVPVGVNPSIGFIFYPGGGVDFRAYAPPLREIAAQGYLVVLPSMPLNLAFFNANAADNAIEDFPDLKTWVIGGHSLGGVAAAGYAADHTAIDGVVFWASYPAGNTLIERGIPVLSIYGSLDGLATPQDIQDSRALLPPDAIFVEIEGGNHSQFGSYGLQSGDNTPAIPPEEQWTMIVDATVFFLENLSK